MIKSNLSNLILEHMRSRVINSRSSKSKTILCSRLITVVLKRKPFTKSLGEVGGPIKDELRVFSTTHVFNINSVFKMRMINAKDNIKSNSKIKKLIGQISGSHDIPFSVGDSYASIFEEDYKVVIQEYIIMYHSNQEIPLVCLPLPRALQDYDKKRTRQANVVSTMVEKRMPIRNKLASFYAKDKR